MKVLSVVHMRPCFIAKVGPATSSLSAGVESLINTTENDSIREAQANKREERKTKSWSKWRTQHHPQIHYKELHWTHLTHLHYVNLMCECISLFLR